MRGLKGLHNKISLQYSVLRVCLYREHQMSLTIILVISLIILFIIFQTSVMPVVLKTYGERTRRQVSEMTSSLRTQLDRVEAQQRTVVEEIVMMKSYAVNPGSAGKGGLCSDASQEYALFSAVMRTLGQRVGGRFWLVDESGQVVAEPAGVNNLKLLSAPDLPMADPLKSLLARKTEGRRQAIFRTASGEHILVVQPVINRPWLLAIDMPDRCLNENTAKIIYESWPLVTMTLACTLQLLRDLLQHIPVMQIELPALILESEAGYRAVSAGIPAICREISEQIQVISGAAQQIGRLNEQLNRMPGQDANLTAMLADSCMAVVCTVSELSEAARRIVDACAMLVPLLSRAYTCALHSSDNAFAREAKALAQCCARSAGEIPGIFTNPSLMESGNLPPEYRSNAQLCEELGVLNKRLKQGIRL